MNGQSRKNVIHSNSDDSSKLLSIVQKVIVNMTLRYLCDVHSLVEILVPIVVEKLLVASIVNMMVIAFNRC